MFLKTWIISNNSRTKQSILRAWRETAVTKISIFFTKVSHLAIKSLNVLNHFLGKQWKFRCHCSFWAMALKFALFTKGSKLHLNQGFQNRSLVTTVSRQDLDLCIKRVYYLFMIDCLVYCFQHCVNYITEFRW